MVKSSAAQQEQSSAEGEIVELEIRPKGGLTLSGIGTSGSQPSCFGTGTAPVAASASIYVAQVTHREAEVIQASNGLLCSSLYNDLDEGFQSKMHNYHPDQLLLGGVPTEGGRRGPQHSRRGSAGLPGAISHEVPLAVLYAGFALACLI